MAIVDDRLRADALPRNIITAPPEKGHEDNEFFVCNIT